MKFCGAKLTENLLIDYCRLQMMYLIYPKAILVFPLQFKQASGTETAVIVLTDILHLVEIEMHYTALAFGVRIGLTLYC
jgi:hypothetical protein